MMTLGLLKIWETNTRLEKILKSDVILGHWRIRRGKRELESRKISCPFASAPYYEFCKYECTRDCHLIFRLWTGTTCTRGEGEGMEPFCIKFLPWKFVLKVFLEVLVALSLFSNCIFIVSLLETFRTWTYFCMISLIRTYEKFFNWLLLWIIVIANFFRTNFRRFLSGTYSQNFIHIYLSKHFFSKFGIENIPNSSSKFPQFQQFLLIVLSFYS